MRIKSYKKENVCLIENVCSASKYDTECLGMLESL